MSKMLQTMPPQEPFHPPTPAELQRIVRRAHAGQARALRVSLRSAAQWFRRMLKGCGTALSGVLLAVSEWQRQRRTCAELGYLSDDMLKDIGVCRSEIPWLAQHGRSDHPSRTIAVSRLRQRLPHRFAPVVAANAASPDKHAA